MLRLVLFGEEWHDTLVEGAKDVFHFTIIAAR